MRTKGPLAVDSTARGNFFGQFEDFEDIRLTRLTQERRTESREGYETAKEKRTQGKPAETEK